MKAVFFSSKGPIRPTNEDGFYLKEVLMDQDQLAPEFRDLGDTAIVAVADGMGGGPGGREAAFLVLEKLTELTQFPLDPAAPSRIANNLLEAARVLTLVANKNPTLRHMGSTVAGLWLGETQGLVFNSGDSRVYRLRAGFLDLLTEDHSLVYELYLSGQIAEKDIATHPFKNILTSSIQDAPEEPRVFTRSIQLIPGDGFFLCTDGIWELLSREELESYLALGPEVGAKNLTKAILKKAQDNLTFVWLY
ncbi:MAG: protein phosphatase 2C domain-containing protein [Deltaproteobacteria bacterium]|nr:protein phosphatase 2C domain-containing protein [Deltaproteobacteria bacterium]